jgi:hypothetical protein
MSAKKMFEKLGYEYKEDDYFITYENDKLVKYVVLFSKEYMCVEITPTCNGNIHTFVRISEKLLQAINKQIEELGWDK